MHESWRGELIKTGGAEETDSDFRLVSRSSDILRLRRTRIVVLLLTFVNALLCQMHHPLINRRCTSAFKTGIEFINDKLEFLFITIS